MALLGASNFIETSDLVVSSFLDGASPELLRVPIGNRTLAWQTPNGVTTAFLRVLLEQSASVRAVALSRTNLTTNSTFRIRAGEVESFVDVAPSYQITISEASSNLPAGFSVTRTHSPTNVAATRCRVDGTWEEVAANSLRIHAFGTAGSSGWLREPSRTNRIRNPRAEGTAGAAPTNWSLTNATAQGISRDIMGVQTINGVQGFVQRLYGTATTQTNIDNIFEGTTAIAAAQGETWSQSQFVAVLAGSLAGFTVIRARAIPYIGGSSGTPQVGPNLAPDGALRRFAHTATLPDAGTTSVQPRFTVTVAAGATVDVTLFLGWPQMELGAFATTPILPPRGTRAASTRGAETGALVLDAPIDSGTLYLEQTILDRRNPSSSSVRVSDGTVANSVEIITNSDAGLWNSANVTAGGNTAASLGSASQTVLINSRIRSALTWGVDGADLFQEGALMATSATSASSSVSEVSFTNTEITSIVHSLRLYPRLSSARGRALSGTGSPLLPLTYDSGVIQTGVFFGVGQALHIMPQPVSSRVFQIDIWDETNPDNFLNIPLAYLGPAMVVPLSPASEMGREVRRGDVTTRGGAVMVEALSAARTWDLIVPSMEDSLTLELDRISATASVGKNILFVPREDSVLAPSEAVFGLLSPGKFGFFVTSGALRNWRATIIERL